MSMRSKTLLLSGLFVIAILACGGTNINISSQPDLVLTITAQAFFIQQTSQVQALPVPGIANTSAPIPAVTNTPEPSATPQKPVVNKTTLCWRGPGAKYEVVSSLNSGDVVEVIGRGSIPGWFIINNPRYHDPCWVQAGDLKIDASFDINTLQVITPPALPSKTPKPTKVPTPTP